MVWEQPLRLLAMKAPTIRVVVAVREVSKSLMWSLECRRGLPGIELLGQRTE